MLSPTFFHKEEVNRLYKRAIMTSREKYAIYSSYASFELVRQDDALDSDWGSISRVSLNEDGDVVGVMSVDISRDHNTVNGLFVISFSDAPNLEFVRDLLRFVDLLLAGYKFHRLEFSAIMDNPARKAYDRTIGLLGGRAIGVCHESNRLLDGEYHDKKMYEILRSEYLGIPKCLGGKHL